jgi:hypothetical protein
MVSRENPGNLLTLRREIASMVVQIPKSMPPKVDPYATRLHRRVDAALLLLTIILFVVMFRPSAGGTAPQPPLKSKPGPAISVVLKR